MFDKVVVNKNLFEVFFYVFSVRYSNFMVKFFIYRIFYFYMFKYFYFVGCVIDFFNFVLGFSRSFRSCIFSCGFFRGCKWFIL